MHPPLSVTCLVAFGAVATSTSTSAFDAGSSGARGALVVESDTVLELPEDGTLHLTRVHVAPGATLRFRRAPGNPPVRLLAKEDVLIEGTIDVSGETAEPMAWRGGTGGPGGFDGGPGGGEPGLGAGPGGGQPGADAMPGDDRMAGAGAHATTSGRSFRDPTDGLPHGDRELAPFLGGSGGGGSPKLAGAGGGGAILVASSTGIRIDGAIRARGGSSPGCASNSGAGGTIHLVAPTVLGAGELDVAGGQGDDACKRAGHGRVRVDVADPGAIELLAGGPPGAIVLASRLVLEPEVPTVTIDAADGRARTWIDLEVAEGRAAPVELVLVGRHLPAGPFPVRLIVTPEVGERWTAVRHVDVDHEGRARGPVKLRLGPGRAKVVVEPW